MEQFKRYRLPVLFCVILVLLALGAGIAINLMSGMGSAAEHVSMGQRYLNDLNYSEAILEFTNAIEMNPSSREARQGLSTAYMATGNYSFAADVLEDVQDPYQPDEEISSSLADIYYQAGNIGKAVQLVNQLVGLTDDDQYYNQRDELMREWHGAARTRAAGTDQELAISNGSVVSRGRNTLGQLGTDNGLGDPEYEQTEFASAQFDGTPRSVYCAGRTSYVLDTSGNLWAAGENRWGQMGDSYATTLPESGWIQLTDTGDVLDAAGIPGRMLVLKADCSLWEAGAGAGQTMRRISDLGAVVQIASYGQALYVLTADGGLYESGYGSYYYSAGNAWNSVANDVVAFQVCSAGAVWLTSENTIGSNFGVPVPEGWTQQEDGTVLPDLEVVSVASDGSDFLLLCSDGSLYLLDGNTVTSAGDIGKVTDMYYTDNMLCVALEDGSTLALQDGQLQPVTG